MPRRPETPDRSLIDLRDERDDLRVRLSLFADNRLTPSPELVRLKQDIAALERRIADLEKSPG